MDRGVVRRSPFAETENRERRESENGEILGILTVSALRTKPGSRASIGVPVGTKKARERVWPW